jgi:hypothetical protein
MVAYYLDFDILIFGWMKIRAKVEVKRCVELHLQRCVLRPEGMLQRAHLVVKKIVNSTRAISIHLCDSRQALIDVGKDTALVALENGVVHEKVRRNAVCVHFSQLTAFHSLR